jgi:hypothetical protein
MGGGWGDARFRSGKVSVGASQIMRKGGKVWKESSRARPGHLAFSRSPPRPVSLLSVIVSC